MMFLILFGLVASAVASPHSRIVNGQEAQEGIHIHQASLQMRSSGSWYHICGAVLIGSNKVLTAAHCVDGQSAANLRVEVGAHNLYEAPNQWEQTVSVSRFTMHQQYNGNANGYPNDIAVIFLASHVNFNERVGVAQLAEKGMSFADTMCRITGWGRLSGSGSGSDVLMEANITKISRQECITYWPSNYITDKHICLIRHGTSTSACSGDSGGPLMCGPNMEYMAGVTSWGVSTCSGAYPSVYTRVSEYRDWINATN